MWVYSRFPGDTNRTLMRIQHDLYGGMVSAIFRAARNRYLEACGLVEVETELSGPAREMTGFDHRTLQDTHDTIAAWFRFARDDGGQMRLGELDQDYETRLATEWNEFLLAEVAALARIDEFARAVLMATVFANRERGYAAEKELREILRGQYHGLTG